MQLEPHHIHIWKMDLAISRKLELELELFTLLSEEERERADRFLSLVHRQRFIAAHGGLRQILSRYLNLAPKEISFTYSPHKKPALAEPNSLDLQFNLSHSDELAVCALTLRHAIGIDIEKMKISYNPDVAKRFFTAREYQDLLNLAPEERTTGFYRLWSRKEAVIKAQGQGLALSLPTFSVSVNEEEEIITLGKKDWTLIPLSIHPHYQSALATDQEVKKIAFFDQQYS